MTLLSLPAKNDPSHATIATEPLSEPLSEPTPPLIPRPITRPSPEPIADPTPNPIIVQAKRDIDAGLVDTDMHATPGLDAQRRSKLVPGAGGKNRTSGG